MPCICQQSYLLTIDAGKGLIKRVLIAGTKQGTPLSDWKTNVSKLLTGRYKRDGSLDQTVITRAVTIYKNPEGISCPWIWLIIVIYNDFEEAEEAFVVFYLWNHHPALQFRN